MTAPNSRIPDHPISRVVPSKRPDAGLWIVATPIGNLRDMTARAFDVLAAADLVACEDTRRTGRLLAAAGIESKLLSYHDHSSAKKRERLIEHLKEGKLVALVSDAGTPLISDPGYKLVRDALEENLPVTCAPGPSAPLAALVISGLPTDRFLFAGYLPARDQARRKAIEELAGVRASLIFLESPRRLAASLEVMKEILGDRPAAVARELTKLHEEVRRGGLSALAAAFGGSPAPKGEVVILIGPPPDIPPADAETLLDNALRSMSVRDAVAAVATETGQRRKEIYARALRRQKP